MLDLAATWEQLPSNGTRGLKAPTRDTLGGAGKTFDLIF